MKNKTHLPLTFLVGFLIGSSILLGGCKDDPSIAGIDLMPGSEFFKPMADISTPIEAVNTHNSIRSDDAYYGILGTYNDPIFGIVKSDFLVQFLPELSTTGITELRNYPKVDLILDSLVLNVAFAEKSWKGDSSAMHRVSIYELSNPLNANKYDSDMSVDGLYYPEPLITKVLSAADAYNIKTRIVDTIIGTDTTWVDKFLYNKQAGWQLKMPQELATRFFDYMVSDSFPVEDKAFANYFNGIYVTSELENSDKTSLIGINLVDNQYLISFSLSYRKITRDALNVITGTIVSALTFSPGYEVKRINRFSHEASSFIAEDDPSVKNLFIEGMAGNYAKIKLDTAYLYAWKDSLFMDSPRYGISNIELTLEVDTLVSDIDANKPLSEMQVWLKRENGELTDKPFFKSGYKSGYVFQQNTNTSIPYAIVYNADSKSYQLKLNPYYFEAFMAYKKYGADHALFAKGGKYDGFTKKDATTGEFLYIFELDELALMPFTPDRNMGTVVLKSPVHDQSPIKLKVQYFTFE